MVQTIAGNLVVTHYKLHTFLFAMYDDEVASSFLLAMTKFYNSLNQPNQLTYSLK